MVHKFNQTKIYSLYFVRMINNSQIYSHQKCVLWQTEFCWAYLFCSRIEIETTRKIEVLFKKMVFFLIQALNTTECVVHCASTHLKNGELGQAFNWFESLLKFFYTWPDFWVDFQSIQCLYLSMHPRGKFLRYLRRVRGSL